MEIKASCEQLSVTQSVRSSIVIDSPGPVRLRSAPPVGNDCTIAFMARTQAESSNSFPFAMAGVKSKRHHHACAGNRGSGETGTPQFTGRRRFAAQRFHQGDGRGN